MKAKIIDPHNLRTEVPIEILITGSEKKPRVESVKLGEVTVKKRGEEYFAQFYTLDAGSYEFEISAGDKTQILRVDIQDQKYLGFTEHFLPWLILTFIILGGILLWNKRYLQSRKN